MLIEFKSHRENSKKILPSPNVMYFLDELCSSGREPDTPPILFPCVLKYLFYFGAVSLNHKCFCASICMGLFFSFCITLLLPEVEIMENYDEC